MRSLTPHLPLIAGLLWLLALAYVASDANPFIVEYVSYPLIGVGCVLFGIYLYKTNQKPKQ